MIIPEPNTALLYAALLLAVAIGWYMGRKQGKRSARKECPTDSPNIDFMLAESNDKALDRLLDLSEIDDEAFELYLNLGKSLREKGLVDKSIQLHQGLFARTDLSERKIQQVQLELATDFMKAGLFDRAERLFSDLLKSSGKNKSKVVDLLIQLFEEQKDWANILELYQQYTSSFISSILLRRASHAACQLAEQALQVEDILSAQQYLRQALKIDRSCARANVLYASIAQQQGEHKEAIRCYLKALKQDDKVMGSILDDLVECFLATEDYSSLDLYLQKHWHKRHDINVLIARVKTMAQKQGADDALAVLLSELNHYPSTKGFFALAELAVGFKAELDKSQLFTVYDILRRIVSSEARYVCQRCGFKAKEHHWRCPSCKDWASLTHVMPSISSQLQNSDLE